MIARGIYQNLRSEEYHSDPHSFSRSSLMDYKRCPYYFYAKHLDPNRPKEQGSVDKDFGNAFHMFLLEPELFSETYAIEPKRVLLKDVGREAFEAYKSEVEKLKVNNRKILTAEQFETLSAMRDKFFKNDNAKKLIQDAIFESSFFWDDDSGLMLKSRPDVLTDNVYVDIKTCKFASSSAFQRSIVDYGYHIQAAMVVDGYKELTGKEIKACINICVEKVYPYAIGIYVIDEAAIDVGREEYKRLCVDLKNALEHNDFPDYSIETVGLPRWYQ